MRGFWRRFRHWLIRKLGGTVPGDSVSTTLPMMYPRGYRRRREH